MNIYRGVQGTLEMGLAHLMLQKNGTICVFCVCVFCINSLKVFL